MDAATTFRPATPADYSAFARLFPELGTGEPAPSPRTWAEQFAPHSFVIEHRGSLVGYLYCQILDGLGYIRHVVVDPKHRGRGIGRRLMEEAARRIRQAGEDRWCLNVKPDNEPAIRLYTRMGMSFEYASVASRMDWTILERLPAAPPELVSEPLPPGEEVATEEALALPSGLLLTQRERDGVVLLRARQGEAIVGMAAFQPSFPGAYPFRARSAAVARSLLKAMRPHADPSRDYVQLVFEGAPALAEAFDEAGAWRHLEFVHFSGEVPGAG